MNPSPEINTEPELTRTTWTEFERQQPALAEAGRRQLYQIHIGLAFLATIRPNGGPRVHPVCPIISAAGLHLSIIEGPKQADLRRDGRYALHSETCPPPRQDDGFAITGRAREITDPEIIGAVRGQVRAERDGQVWPGFDEEAVFELRIERCLLMQTRAGGAFPAGPTSWRAGDRGTGGTQQPMAAPISLLSGSPGLARPWGPGKEGSATR